MWGQDYAQFRFQNIPKNPKQPFLRDIISRNRFWMSFWKPKKVLLSVFCFILSGISYKLFKKYSILSCDKYKVSHFYHFQPSYWTPTVGLPYLEVMARPSGTMPHSLVPKWPRKPALIWYSVYVAMYIFLWEWILSFNRKSLTRIHLKIFKTFPLWN